MDYQEVLTRLYSEYVVSKDKFVERSFLTNRFYLVITFALLLFQFWQLDHITHVTGLFIITAALGMGSSLLWVLNHDAYSYLIKIKLAGVLEKMEEHLPVKPSTLEHDAIIEHNKKQKIMFADYQKGMGFSAFLIFFSLFLFSTGTKLVEYIETF